MKIVIFAGGTGRRLWPISRKSSPKQFEAIIGTRSTVQLAVERVEATYGLENIFISSNVQYLDILQRQLPRLPEENFIGEPARRDLAAAVGLAMTHLARRFDKTEQVAIIWGDSYMSKPATFLELLNTAGHLLEAGQAKIIFIGETARFANENLGWIGLGEKRGDANGQPHYAFDSWVYRPPLDECRRMLAAGKYVWNTGYFVTTVGFMCQAYQEHQPEMWASLQEIGLAIGRPEYQAVLAELYPELPVIHFDDAIAKNIHLDEALVLHGNMGWSDPGTLYALKEAINPDGRANVKKGLVLADDSNDCLLYNYEAGKLLVAIGLEGMIVVNTEDAILVVHKDDVPLVKQMVDGLAGTELESYG
ncbi:MAG: hypothetical protein L0332_03975 [Chloroflexi bacterium]|nr:hypothetical protein [Chloroflexota bacterium]MCI0579236.1 hypothetical protein [Chloroflexota bacterium]MCI0647093.1 hypothetical protein [Chloroflexota bacterium]MCI0725867.1 hypothetical protein [Chloroflexota bacterium]